jgi:hypothetical protein
MRIKFTSIVLRRLDANYFNLEAFDGDGKVVYKATISDTEACKVAEKYNNVKIN